MEVQLKFHTEKEDINELKKLQTWLAELIAKRESAVTSKVKQQKHEVVKQEQAQQSTFVQSAPKPAATEQQKKEYPGHGKVIEFEDISDTMSKIYGGGRL